MFGYVKKSKILEIIDSERYRLSREDMKSLNNFRLIEEPSQKDKEDYIYESCRLRGGYGALLDLYCLIEEEL